MASFLITGGAVFSGPSLERYRAAVRTVIQSVRQTSAGRALLMANGAVRDDRPVLIEPEPRGWDFFAHVRVVREPVVDSSEFAPMHQAARGGSNRPPPRPRTLAARIMFTPGNWRQGWIWDERVVFCHELVHAYRAVAGTEWAGAATPNNAYPNIEEFYAVAAANVLRSELNLPLRKGYKSGSHGVDPVFQELCRRMGSFGGCLSLHSSEYPRRPSREDLVWLSCRFATRYREALERQAGERFFVALASMTAIPFNPFVDVRSPRM